ncbi:murein hydrolase activator EnvC family protein [Ferviditalea candida]|uniref:Peptidoglycan DD-metalloendopeptidase family protein n=1 Tax=Ferviditalea candida TaxID=3108399 RepID=A0ABU5ZIN9_9BACL|nr:peptidoglycan DD-metalloendopeptidase family protein [Paenibacillaceae bacterium T2]
MKKLILPLLASIILFSSVFFPYQGHAESSLDEINRQLRELEKQKENAAWQRTLTERKINQVIRDKKQAKEEFNSLLLSMDRVSAELNQYQQEIDKTTDEVLQAGKDLQDAEGRVASRDQLIRAKLRLMYSNGMVQYIDVLLSSTDFSDFLDRLDSLTAIIGQDKSILEANKRDRDMIARTKNKIEQDLGQLKNLYAKLEEKQQSLLVQEEKKKVLVASLDQTQKELEEASEEQEKALIALASKVAQLNKEKNKLQMKQFSGGKLAWPLPEIFRISSGFGYRVDPITGKRGAFHNGTDIAAPGGTDVLAAADGVVLVAQWWGGFGNCVIIDHGNGMWTLYGHMLNNSIRVKKDQVVKKGQLIGNVGSTGRSTGNHLHFGVYLDEKPVDPMNYLK